MADRSTLWVEDLDAFVEHLKSKGWTIEATKGQYEVMRPRNPSGKVFPIYAKEKGARGNPKRWLTVYGDVQEEAERFYAARYNEQRRIEKLEKKSRKESQTIPFISMESLPMMRDIRKDEIEHESTGE